MRLLSVAFALLGTLACGSLAAPHTHKNHTLPQKSIEQAVKDVSVVTEKLDKSLGDSAIGHLKAAKVYFKCKAVGKTIKEGIQHAHNSEDLILTGAFKVLIVAEALVGVVNSTMEDLISHYYDFAKLPLVPLLPVPGAPHLDTIVLKILKKQKDLTEQFGTAILEKVPEATRHDGNTRLLKIYASFAKAIKVYENNKSAAELAAEEAAIPNEFASI